MVLPNLQNITRYLGENIMYIMYIIRPFLFSDVSSEACYNTPKATSSDVMVSGNSGLNTEAPSDDPSEGKNLSIFFGKFL